MIEFSELYFDDSGNTGDDLGHDAQRNLFIAGVLIPVDKVTLFAAATDSVWRNAEEMTGIRGVELKGADIYGGKGQFKSTEGAARVGLIERLVDAIIDHELPILWQGLPKWMAQHGGLSTEVWKKTLFGYCSLLGELFERLDPAPRSVLVVGDENTWIGERCALCPPPQAPWPSFVDGDVKFHDSGKVRGLQVADIVVHTLYRANKSNCPDPQRPVPQLSNTDRTALAFHQKLARAGRWQLLDSSSPDE